MAKKSSKAKSSSVKAASVTTKTTSPAQAAADSKALASMNKVRASQGLAAQTEVGVKAPSRSGVGSTINKVTNEVVDKSGKVIGKGSSLSEALAIQNQLGAGSTPTISGRPDLLGAKALAGEGGTYFDKSINANVTQRTITDDERTKLQAGTLDSFNKSQGLTYLDGSTFKNLQNVLSEGDLIRGPEGQIWLKQGLSIEDVQARQAKVPAATSPTMSDVSIEVPSTIDTETYDNAFTMPTTTADIEKLVEENEALQQEYIDSLQVSDEETALQQQIVEVDEEIATYMASYDAGMNAIEDEVIPMSFITGQQATLERRAEAHLANLTRYQDILTKRLGIATSNRELASEAKLAAVNFAASNITMALQIQEAIDAQQDRVLARADKLESGARDTLTTMLSMFQGIDYADLTPELQNTLNTLATKAGIPSDLLMKGMETVKNQMIQAALKKSSGGSSSSSNEEKQITKFRNDAADMILKLDTGEVTWGAAWDNLKTIYPDVSNDTLDGILGGGYNPSTGEYEGRAK